MKIILPNWAKNALGMLVGGDKRNEIVTFLESDLKAAWDALKAIPGDLQTGNIDRLKINIASFLDHLPQPVREAIVKYVIDRYNEVNSLAAAK